MTNQTFIEERRPYSCKKEADDILEEFSILCKKLNIVDFLWAGTCLGIWRDKNYTFPDPDIDVGVLCSTDEWARLKKELTDNGFYFEEDNDGFNSHFIKYGLTLDIYYNFGDRKFVEKFDSVEYNGRKYRVPSPVEEYLKALYGEMWKTPLFPGADLPDIGPDEELYELKKATFFELGNLFFVIVKPGGLRKLVKYLDSDAATKLTVTATDRGVEKYVSTRGEPEIVLNHLERFIKLVGSGWVLDAGCGHGRDCRFFELNGFNCVGIDLSEEMLKKAKEVSKSVFLNMDMRVVGKLPWVFDGVWCCASFYHIPKRFASDTLKQFSSVLKKDGVLFLAVKSGAGEGFWYNDDAGMAKFYAVYTKEEITKLVEEGGFTVVDVVVERKRYEWINIYARKS